MQAAELKRSRKMLDIVSNWAVESRAKYLQDYQLSTTHIPHFKMQYIDVSKKIINMNYIIKY